MPFLPAAAAVAGIISCFQSAASLFTAYKSRREATKRHDQIQGQRKEDKSEAAEKSLESGPKHVQSEYDQRLALVGRSFAHGDDTGRMQLMTELISLQKTVIAVLQSGLTTGYLDLSQLAQVSTARRTGAVTALQNQSQRMAIAAPVQRPMLRAPRPRLCSEADRLFTTPNAAPRFEEELIPNPRFPGRYGQRCLGCASIWDIRPSSLIRDSVSGMRYPSDFQYRCHTKVKDLYLCYLCGDDSPVLQGFGQLMDHVRGHDQTELLAPACKIRLLEYGGGMEDEQPACEEDHGHWVWHSASARTSPVGTPGATPRATPRGTPMQTPRDTPMQTPVGTPMCSRRGTPVSTPRGTPAGTPVCSPPGSPCVPPPQIHVPMPKSILKSSPRITTPHSRQGSVNGNPSPTFNGFPRGTPAHSRQGSMNYDPMPSPNGLPRGTPVHSRQSSLSGEPMCAVNGIPTPMHSRQTSGQGPPSAVHSRQTSGQGYAPPVHSRQTSAQGYPTSVPSRSPSGSPQHLQVPTPRGTPRGAPVHSRQSSQNDYFNISLPVNSTVPPGSLQVPAAKSPPRTTPTISRPTTPKATPRATPSHSRQGSVADGQHDRNVSAHSSDSEESPRSAWSDWGDGSDRDSVSSVASMMSRASIMGKPPVGRNLDLYVKPD
ncbi:unnamed protein product [Zymoseptoria tritici ST99CH_3D7]|uniref:C2H2-type domain-containing protein n=1 Tax=Zymoseptoria tritici (strain ST99CH_3D7) TaxID=1276538 RepID=A0A1X7RVV0_ZYMT9|nr:unnamed protein product [Zymoseptoria tritici ST99CH_3D7]